MPLEPRGRRLSSATAAWYAFGLRLGQFEDVVGDSDATSIGWVAEEHPGFARAVVDRLIDAVDALPAMPDPIRRRFARDALELDRQAENLGVHDFRESTFRGLTEVAESLARHARNLAANRDAAAFELGRLVPRLRRRKRESGGPWGDGYSRIWTQPARIRELLTGLGLTEADVMPSRPDGEDGWPPEVRDRIGPVERVFDGDEEGWEWQAIEAGLLGLAERAEPVAVLPAVDLETNTVTYLGRSYDVPRDVATALDVLVRHPDDFLTWKRIEELARRPIEQDRSTRVWSLLPRPLSTLVERRPGAGSRLKPAVREECEE